MKQSEIFVLQPVMLKYNKNSHLSKSPLTAAEHAGVPERHDVCQIDVLSVFSCKVHQLTEFIFLNVIV